MEGASGLVISRGSSLEEVGGTGKGMSWGLSGRSEGFCGSVLVLVQLAILARAGLAGLYNYL